MKTMRIALFASLALLGAQAFAAEKAEPVEQAITTDTIGARYADMTRTTGADQTARAKRLAASVSRCLGMGSQAKNTDRKGCPTFGMGPITKGDRARAQSLLEAAKKAGIKTPAVDAQ